MSQRLGKWGYRSSTSQQPANDRSLDREDSSFSWSLTESNVQQLPEIYPRINNPLVICNIPVDAIAKRISQFMRVNSICCKYNTDQGRVVGCTPYASFVVQLWKPQDSTKVEEKTKILIEVTRRHGCSIALHKIRHALAQSIESNLEPRRYESLINSCNQLKPSSRIKAIHRKITKRISNSRGLERLNRSRKDLETSLDLLESESYDEQDLGMENIAYMSDSSKVPKGEAIALARLLIFRDSLKGVEPSSVGARLQNAVEDYVYGLEELRPRLTNENPFHQTLTALSNAMDLLLKDDVSAISAWTSKDSTTMLCVYWRHMIHFFLERLKAFKEVPESAALAARCMRLLMDLTVHTGEGADEIQTQCDLLPNVLQDAHQYGLCFNAHLEREAADLCHTVRSLQ